MANKFDFSNRPRQQVTPADLPGLFSGLGNTAAPGAIVQIPISSLVPWANQPFRPYSDAKMQQLVEDIKTNGVLNPIIVRPMGQQYQILAGHSRTNASREAGLTTVPAIIRDVDDDTAVLIMVNTNLNQRDELLPSEKAWAYRLQLEAMKRQGQKDSGLEGKKSRDILAEQTGENRNQIQRYIRLTYLIPELLEMVDQGMLPMMSGVSLSYLAEDQQHIVCDVSAECDKKISTAQAEKIKRLGQEGAFTADAVRQLLLPAPRWNAANEFVSRSRVLIPKTATEKDINHITVLIRNYFEQTAKERPND